MRAAVILGFLAGACGEQELTAYCTLEGVECPPCSADAECVVLSNPCQETAACVHRDDGTVAVTLEGCNSPHEVPPDSACVCRASDCVPGD